MTAQHTISAATIDQDLKGALETTAKRLGRLHDTYFVYHKSRNCGIKERNITHSFAAEMRGIDAGVDVIHELSAVSDKTRYYDTLLCNEHVAILVEAKLLPGGHCDGRRVTLSQRDKETLRSFQEDWEDLNAFHAATLRQVIVRRPMPKLVVLLLLADYWASNRKGDQEVECLLTGKENKPITEVSKTFYAHMPWLANVNIPQRHHAEIMTIDALEVSLGTTGRDANVARDVRRSWGGNEQRFTKHLLLGYWKIIQLE